MQLTVHADDVAGRVDERIYGQFLEHIFHSVNGGLWGEMVWDRSFEDAPRPEACTRGTVSGGWTTYGPGSFDRTADGPLNSDFCQKISAAKRESGLQQTPFFIEPGQRYHGSLYARGSAHKLVVRMLAGTRVMAETQLSAPSGEWKECRWMWTPRPKGGRRNVAASASSWGSGGLGCDDATLQIGVVDGDVWIDQVSLMPERARRTGGFRPDLLKAVADLRPPTIRWPGGSFTCWYRWKDGIGPQHKRRKYPMHIWGDQDVNSFGTDEFIALCRKVGAEPVICLNIGALEPEDQRETYIREACDWVQYCNGSARSKWGKIRAANGQRKPYNVRYWEIGNEVWNLKPAAYARIVKRFAVALKTVDPTIKLISCGSGEFGATWAAGDTAVLSRCADVVDFHSIHHYREADHYATAPVMAERYYRRMAGRIARSRNPDMTLYVSEWNAQSTDWRTGLYAGGILNVFERCSDIIPMACPALFLRHVSASGWDNAFINFDHKSWFPGPNYVVMKLWRDHYAPHRLRTTGRTGDLNVVATKSEDGSTVYVKVVNPSHQAVEVTTAVTGDFAPRRAAMKLVTAPGLCTRNMLGDPDRIRAVARPVHKAGETIRFTMPGLSAGVVTIEGA